MRDRPEKRRRRTAEDARARILHVAEARLREVGPEGLRLQDIARAAGISHPTILHHFGSRNGLVAAVVASSFLALEDDLVHAFANAGANPGDLGALFESVHEVMDTRGHARLLAWLALGRPSGPPIKVESRLHDVAVAAHAAREALAGRAIPFEDTLFAVVLASLSTFATSLLGRVLLRTSGLPDDDATLARFRGWTARRFEQLALTGITAPSPPVRATKTTGKRLRKRHDSG